MSPRRCAIALVAVSALLLTSCMNQDAQSAYDKVNGERWVRGLWDYGAHETLTQKGQAWAESLLNGSGDICSSYTLKHSNLATAAPAGWRSLGENVGCARTWHQPEAIPTIHTQFMGSQGHAANILSRVFNYAGIGSASKQLRDGSWLTFEVQEFAAL